MKVFRYISIAQILISIHALDLNAAESAQAVEALPFINKIGFVSNEAKEILLNLEQAKKEEKNLIIVSSAAWCPPCAILHKAFEDEKDAVTRIQKKNRIVFAETENLTSLIYDYLPLTQFFYPTVYLYQFKAKAWSQVSAWGENGVSIEYLEKSINDHASGVDLVAPMMQQFRTDLKEKKKFFHESKDDKTELVNSINLEKLLSELVISKSSMEQLAAVREIIEAIGKNKDLFGDLNGDEIANVRYYLDLNLRGLVSLSAISFSELLKLFPLYADFEKEPESILEKKIKPEQYAIYTNRGIQAAAKQCEETFKTDLLPLKERKLERNTIIKSVSIQGLRCAVLAVQSGELKLEGFQVKYRELLNELTPEEQIASSNSLLSYTAKAGDFEHALAMLEVYATKVSKAYEAGLAELKVKMEQAEKEGKKDDLEAIKASIERKKLVRARVLKNFEERKAAWLKKTQPSAIHVLE